MAKIRRIPVLLGVPLALALGHTANALEPLSAAALLEVCRSYQRDSSTPEAFTCRGYILGYLSASTDIVAEEERAEGLVARAMRTRGMRLSDHAERRLSSRYCLPKGETLSDLVARLSADSRHYAVDVRAEVAMRHLLENHYRCDVAAPE